MEERCHSILTMSTRCLFLLHETRPGYRTAELTFLSVLRKAGRCLCGATRQLQQSEEITTRKTSPPPPPPPPPRLLLFRFSFRDRGFLRVATISQTHKVASFSLSCNRMAQKGRHEKLMSTPGATVILPSRGEGGW